MNKEEYINQILSKMKKTGKIRDVTLASKEAELLIEYVEQLKTILKDINEYIEEHKELKDEYVHNSNGNIEAIRTRCMVDTEYILEIINKALDDNE